MKYTFILLCLFVITSCNDDFLDKTPLSKMSDTGFWNTEKDAVAALSDCYDGWEDYGTLFWFDGISDNLYSQFSWDGYQKYGNGTVTTDEAGNGQKSFYDYKKVRKYNNFLTNIGKVKMDESKKKVLSAEVRFLRAYNYFWKVQMYGDIPLILEVLPLTKLVKKRTPKSEVKKFIFKELTEIISLLPIKPNAKGRIARGAALALKARYELFEGMYSQSWKTANVLMGSEYNYELFNGNYEELFWEANEGSSEIILAAQNIKDKYESNIGGTNYPNTLGGWSSLNPTQSLVDAFETNTGKTIEDDATYNSTNPYVNRDSRLKASIVCPGDTLRGTVVYNSVDKKIGEAKNQDHYTFNNSSRTGYMCRKYLNYKDTKIDIWNMGGDFIVFRYAEVLLTFAEAKIEDNQIDDAMYNAIDQVRVRAKLPKVDRAKYSTQVELRKLIRRERRSELALEGLRYFDIKRWEIGPKVLNGKLYGCRLGTIIGGINLNGDNIQVEDRFFNVKANYLWPIPQKEVDAIGTRQNEGY